MSKGKSKAKFRFSLGATCVSEAWRANAMPWYQNSGLGEIPSKWIMEHC